MFSVLVGALAALALSVPAAAQVTPFPGDFRTLERVRRRPLEDRRGHAGPLRHALCSAGRDPLGLFLYLLTVLRVP
jgi:hypothetical protein